MRACYLHLGFHKTASTSFQKSCASSRDALASAGITYPLFDCLQSGLKGSANHSVPIHSLFCEEPAKYHINIRRGISNAAVSNLGFRTQLETTLRNSESVILSGEGISILSDHSLTLFRDFIQNHGFEIIPFALVRSPYEFTCSQLGQLIKIGYYRPEVSFGRLFDCSAPKQPPHRLHEVIRIRRVFGNDAVLIPFSEACAGQDGPVGYLLRLIGLQDLSGIRIQRANEAMGNTWIRLQNQINRRSPALVGYQLNPNHHTLRKGIRSPAKFLLTEEELHQIRDSLEDINRQTEYLLGPRFLDQRHPVSVALSDEEILDLAIHLCR